MKGLIYGGLSALLMTTMVPGAFAAPAETRVQAQQSDAPMIFNFNAPIIANSGVRGSTHFIRVMVIGMSLQDLMISIPSQMEKFDSIRVTDQSGQEVAAKKAVSKELLSLTFDRPVTPGGYLEVEFTGVQMRNSGGDTLLYGVTAQRVGLQGQIPIGTARILVPGRDGG